MASSARAVSVTGTATRLDTATKTDRASGSSLAFFNNDASKTIYIGGSGVTTATGAPVPAQTWSPGFEFGGGESLYGIVASGTAEARVLETGV